MKTIVPLPDNSGIDDGDAIVSDRKNLEAFLVSKKLWVPKSFLEGIRAHDIIEVYAFPDFKQVYANNEFSRLSSYTEEQMRTIPLQQLFWRDDEDQMKMMERAGAIAKGGVETEGWNVPKHELIESLHPRKRTFEMSMGLLAPCFSIATGERMAFASTLRVDLIYEWPEAV